MKDIHNDISDASAAFASAAAVRVDSNVVERDSTLGEMAETIQAVYKPVFDALEKIYQWAQCCDSGPIQLEIKTIVSEAKRFKP